MLVNSTATAIELLDGVSDANSSPAEIVFERSSAFYRSNFDLWKKAISAYNGGRKYIEKTLVQHPSETTEEFTARKSTSYYVNLIKLSTIQFGDYIFAKEPRRSKANEEILMDFDRQKTQVNKVMRKIFDYHTLCNLSWVLVDMPNLAADSIDIATKINMKIRPWCKVLSPLAVPDWCFDSFGNLEWVLIEEFIVDKANPALRSRAVQRRTLYTKTYYQVFERDITNSSTDTAIDIKVYPAQPNKLGEVPIIPYSSIVFEDDFNTPAIDDILTISDAMLAGESELLTNILKQTYGQLVLPMSSSGMVSRIKTKLLANDDSIDLSSKDVTKIIAQEVGLELSRTKAIFEDGDERGTARFVQPDGANIESIIKHDDRLMNLIMTVIGFMLTSPTTQRASAESKSLDNVTLASKLVNIASSLQELEKAIWRLFNKFDSAIAVPESVDYNKNYNIQELKSMIAGIVELANINGGESYSKQVKYTALQVLDSMCHIDDPTYNTIKEEIKAGNKAKEPITFTEQAKHLTEASGSAPDSIKAKTDYEKSPVAQVSKGEQLK